MPVTTSYSTPRMDLGVALEEYPLTFKGFVASEILPMFSVPRRDAKFSTISRAGILRGANARRSAGGAYSREDWEHEEISYSCQEFGFEHRLADENRPFYASDFNAELVGVAITRDRLAREREKRVAETIFNTSTWTGAELYTDLGTDWDNPAALIVDDVEKAKEQIRKNCGLMPNTIVVSAAVVPWIKANTDMQKRLQYVQAITDQAIMSALSSLLGIERVIVGGAIKNTAAEGETFAGSDVWDDNYCWIGVCPRSNSLAEPCVGRTLLWTADSPTEFTADEYREEQTRSWVYRVRHHLDEKIFDPYFAHLLKIDT